MIFFTVLFELVGIITIGLVIFLFLIGVVIAFSEIRDRPKWMLILRTLIILGLGAIFISYFPTMSVIGIIGGASLITILLALTWVR